jgi:Transposase
MHEKDFSCADLAYVLELNKQQVYNCLQRMTDVEEMGAKVVTRSRSHGAAVKLAISKIMSKNPRTPYRDLPGLLKKDLPDGVDIPSASTCQRYLKEIGFENKKAVKRNFISTSNQEKRLKFAQELLE